MGIRLQRRINLGGGAGINVSKSGFSPSLQTKFGTIGAKGFTIRTGIPGLYYRDVFKSSKKGNGGIVILIFLTIGLFLFAAIVLWNILRMLWWALEEFTHFLMRIYRKRQIDKEAVQSSNSDKVFFSRFSRNDFPEEMKQFKATLEAVLVDEGSFVEKNTGLAVVTVEWLSAVYTAEESGAVTFFKNPGERIKNGDYLYKIKKI
jgi:hypothetical protein